MKQTFLMIIYGIAIAAIADFISPHYPLFSAQDWRENFFLATGILAGYFVSRS